MSARSFVQKFNRGRGLALLLVALLLAGAVYIFGGRSGSGGDEQRAQAACEDFVTQVLQAPAPPQFEPLVRTQVDASHYEIRGNATAQNSSGITEHIPYTCMVAWVSGTTYRVENLKLRAQ